MNALELVQKGYACFGSGDIPGLLQLMSPDISWQFHGDRAAPYTRQVKGTAAVAEWFGQVAQADDIQAFEPREFLAGPDHVTVVGREKTIARPGGKTFECEWVHIWWVKDGRITRFWGMLDSEAAGKARST